MSTLEGNITTISFADAFRASSKSWKEFAIRTKRRPITATELHAADNFSLLEYAGMHCNDVACLLHSWDTCDIGVAQRAMQPIACCSD
jgi:hypothetical protein